MKYKVKISDRSYNVEIEDIHARPVIARVDGQVFEVYPERDQKPEVLEGSSSPKPAAFSAQPVQPIGSIHELTAPLPGTIIEFFVRPGDEIEAGTVVVVIEAMKMKNSIRSTRAGKIANVLVSAGETVAHKQALVEFDE